MVTRLGFMDAHERRIKAQARQHSCIDIVIMLSMNHKSIMLEPPRLFFGFWRSGLGAECYAFQIMVLPGTQQRTS